MARQLWLLRHAEAEPHGSREDSARRLTERGEQQARAAGAAIARMGISFEAIFYSPKVRAAQTAELAAEAWDEENRERMVLHPPLAGGFDAAHALDALAAAGADGHVLLVGHEPDLSQLTASLTGGVAVDLKKGGLVGMRLEGASAQLAVLMRPRELALIAGLPVGGH
jgi:phosphohistidine phosphatase